MSAYIFQFNCQAGTITGVEEVLQELRNVRLLPLEYILSYPYCVLGEIRMPSVYRSSAAARMHDEILTVVAKKLRPNQRNRRRLQILQCAPFAR